MHKGVAWHHGWACGRAECTGQLFIFALPQQSQAAGAAAAAHHFGRESTAATETADPPSANRSPRLGVGIDLVCAFLAHTLLIFPGSTANI